MKTIIQFLLMLTIISTTYSLEPYKIVKIHDSTVFKARLSEDLKTLVVLGDNKVVNFYNTGDWAKTKSIRVNTKADNYNITSSGKDVYWIEFDTWSNNYHDKFGHMSTEDTSKHSVSGIPVRDYSLIEYITDLRADLVILENDSLIISYDANTGGYRNKMRLRYSNTGSFMHLPVKQLMGYNENKKLMIGEGSESITVYPPGGDPPRYGGTSYLNIFDNKFNILWTFNQMIASAFAITRDTNLIGFTNDTIYKVKIKDTTIFRKPLTKFDSYLSSIDDLHYILPMKDERFLLFYFDNEIKLVHTETGFIIDSFKNEAPILMINNFKNDNEFIIVEAAGFAKLFHIDSIINKFTADFISDKRVITQQSEIAFYPYNDLNATSYNWDFGDGMKSNVKEPVHIYYKPGNYDVSLEITDGQRTVQKVERSFIEVKGIKFDSQYTIDTLWTQNYKQSITKIEYDISGTLISTISKDGTVMSINSKTGNLNKSRIIEPGYLEIQVSTDGKTIGIVHKTKLCISSIDSDTCTFNFSVRQVGTPCICEGINFIPSKPLIMVSGICNYDQPAYYFNDVYSTNTGLLYMTDSAYKFQLPGKPSLINRHTGDFLYCDSKGIFIINVAQKTSDTLFKNADYPKFSFSNYFDKIFLYNDQNDLIFLLRDNKTYNRLIYRFTGKEKKLEKIGEIEYDSFKNIGLFSFIENSDNVILLKTGGLLDILDYVKNEIVDHAEIPAEFTGLSINPKGGEFATLSDDGKVIVWKTKNIPLAKYEEPKIDDKLTIYPNPAGDYINIESMLENNSYKTATIYSPLGNKLIETENQTTIDISNLYYGVYFVKVGNRYAKFVKI